MIKKKLLVIGTVLLLIIVIGIYINSVLSGFDPQVSFVTVHFKESREDIYIRAMASGIGGNHNEIIISSNPIIPKDRKVEKEHDYIFYASELYYKKKGADTLLIYVVASSIGVKQKKEIFKTKVVVNELKTYNELRDYELNYEKYGLSRVSLYDISYDIKQLPKAEG